MSTFKNKTILITGGASGIGFLLGKRVLQLQAAKLIIWDVSIKNIQATKTKLQKNKDRLLCMQVDIADQKQIESASQSILQQFSQVDIIINNAGIIVGKSFHEHTAQEINRTIAVNLTGAMHITNAFLPAMIEQKSGHIVNIASAAGRMANPGMSVYAASKWGMIGWSESLRIEMEQQKTGVRLTTVEPSYIDTGMFAGVKPPLLTPLLDPEAFSNAIIGAIQNNKIILRKPFMVKIIPFLKGIMPTRMFDFIAGTLFHVYSSMDDFEGRDPT